MADQLFALTESEYYNLFVPMARWWKARLEEKPSAKFDPIEPMPRICVALLADVDSEQPVDAAILRIGSTNERQLVDMRGEAADGDSFRLAFKPSDNAAEELTAPISANASPDDVQSALLALPSLNDGDVLVQFGRHTRINGSTYSMKRWLIEFTGQYAGVNVPLLRSEIAAGSSLTFTVTETTVLYDSGATRQVRNLIPIGIPTPLKFGAICLCGWLEGFGYVIDAAEPRSIEDIVTGGNVY